MNVETLREFYRLWHSTGLEWSHEDTTKASMEGWYISWVLRTIRSGVVHGSNDHDVAAREHVKRRADEGSEFHQRALHIAITMQIMAGEL
jgi:hypothetical protein